VRYEALTDGYLEPTRDAASEQAAPSPAGATSSPEAPQANQEESAASASSSCSCSTDGMSGGIPVGLPGCRQHGLDYGDTSYWCYATGGTACTTATASAAYPGAAPRHGYTSLPASHINLTSLCLRLIAGIYSHRCFHQVLMHDLHPLPLHRCILGGV
jgi:hypothetical protein